MPVLRRLRCAALGLVLVVGAPGALCARAVLVLRAACLSSFACALACCASKRVSTSCMISALTSVRLFSPPICLRSLAGPVRVATVWRR